MSRKMKYLTKEDDFRAKWLAGEKNSYDLILHPENIAYRKSKHDRFIHLNGEGRSRELEHARLLAGDRNYSDEQLTKNRKKTERLTNYKSEQKLFSYHALNRFLNEKDDRLTLKEFLDERWDTIIDEMNRLIFDEFKHSARLYEQFSYGDGFLLTIRQGGSREARDAVESLTVAQVRDILKAGLTSSTYGISSNILHNVPAGMVKEVIGKILNPNADEVPTFISERSLFNQLYRGLTKSIASHEGGYPVDLLMERALVYVPRTANVFHNEQKVQHYKASKHGVIPNGYVAPFVELLSKRGDEFHPITYFSIIYALGEPRAFTSEAGLKGASLFKVAYACDGERKIAFLRAIGEIVSRHRGALPRNEHWEGFLKGEGVEESVELGAEFILAMISNEEDMRDQRAKTTHAEFHAVLNRLTR